jgi:hypothetical protein
MKLCTKCNAGTVAPNKSCCPACKSIYDAKYRKENKKKLAQLNKNWYDTNIQHCKKVRDDYYNSDHGRITCLILAAKRRAYKKLIEFDLSEQFIIELLHKQNNKCALTKIEFDILKIKKSKTRPFAMSIDRIDSSKGYTKDNVRLVCVAVNLALNEFGEDIFNKICKAYLEARNST